MIGGGRGGSTFFIMGLWEQLSAFLIALGLLVFLGRRSPIAGILGMGACGKLRMRGSTWRCDGYFECLACFLTWCFSFLWFSSEDFELEVSEPYLVLMPSAWCYLDWSERIIRSSGDFNSFFYFYNALFFALVMKFITYNLSPYKTWAKMVDHQTAKSSIFSGNQKPPRLRHLLACIWVFGWHKFKRGPVVMQKANMTHKLGILGYPWSLRIQYWGVKWSGANEKWELDIKMSSQSHIKIVCDRLSCAG